MAKTKPYNAPTAVLLSKGGLNILQRRANLYRPMLGLGLVAGVLAFVVPRLHPPLLHLVCYSTSVSFNFVFCFSCCSCLLLFYAVHLCVVPCFSCLRG